MIIETTSLLIGLSGTALPAWLWAKERSDKTQMELEYNIKVAQSLGHAATLSTASKASKTSILQPSLLSKMRKSCNHSFLLGVKKYLEFKNGRKTTMAFGLYRS
jgi:hypothetical protein